MQIYTIGHSNKSILKFVENLSSYSINTICDVRSIPYSKYSSQFNKHSLANFLISQGIDYQYLGNLLGGRSRNPLHYSSGKIDYSLISKSHEFLEGLDYILLLSKKMKLALMCSENDPILCHRAILITHYLKYSPISISHILNDEIESNENFENRLLISNNLPDHDLFTSRSEFIELAYKLQAEKIAFSNGDYL